MHHLTEKEISALQENESGKDMPKTPEQIEAIYRTGTNILVSASAGSGKTFVMTERILYYIFKRQCHLKVYSFQPLQIKLLLS